MKSNRTLQLVVIAIFSALSILLYFVKFPLPIFPSFLEIQFSNLPAIIGGYALGPIGGSAIVIVRTIIKLPFSSTVGVGELVDLIIGISTVLASSLIYRKMKTKKGAIIGMAAGMVAWIVVAIAANYFFVIDFYVELWALGSYEPLLASTSMIPGITAENFLEKYIIYGALPFNILLSGIVYGITFLVYKRISHLINELAMKFEKK